MKNEFGLSRQIPNDIKRTVRQQCGFGCVICGSSIIQYEHVDPEFHAAKEHDPNCIVLLCPQCHSKVTTGFWSKEKVKEAMRQPFCKINGFAKEAFDFNNNQPSIVFGGTTISNCPIPIQVKGLPLFHIKPPQASGQPFLLSSFFCDSSGLPSLIIIDNEWFALSTNWDIETSGGRITIRERMRKISLKLKANPPHGIIIEKLDMYLFGLRFLASPDELLVRSLHGGEKRFVSCIVSNCQVGMAF